jgi:hypothetical protein
VVLAGVQDRLAPLQSWLFPRRVYLQLEEQALVAMVLEGDRLVWHERVPLPEGVCENGAPVAGEGPFAAVVTAVHSDACISLAILAPFASNVLIGSSVMHKDVAQGDYWCWPPRE